jgi:hypothetical protein
MLRQEWRGLQQRRTQHNNNLGFQGILRLPQARIPTHSTLPCINGTIVPLCMQQLVECMELQRLKCRVLQRALQIGAR